MSKEHKGSSEVEEVIGLEFSIDSVFSLLPDQDAMEARQAVIDNALSDQGRFNGALRWAEFSFDGEFLRGGLSQLEDLSTRIVNDPNEDSDMRRLTDRAIQLDLRPGLVEALPGEDHFVWFVPYTPSRRDKRPETVLRGLSVTLDLFSQIVDLFNTDAELTRAEKRTAFQLVAGHSLRMAATIDNVGVETKRAQIKSAISKMDCGGQTDLVRLLMGQLIHFIYASEGESAHTEVAERFSAEHLGPDVRLTVQRLPNGRLLRLYEAGPPDGEPVLMIHGFLFPFVPINAPKWLEKENIRLIMPIRVGYLDEGSATTLYKSEDAVEQTLEDLSLYLTHYWRRPITVMGELAGGAMSIVLTRRNPDQISNLILLAINLAKGDTDSDTFAKRFFGGLRKLVMKPGLFRFIAWQFRRFNSTRFAMRSTMGSIMKECQSDVDAMEGKVGAGPAYGWFIDFLSHSTVGFADDFQMIIKEDWRGDFQKIERPITFIHGRPDSITHLKDVEELARLNGNATIRVLEEGGHFATASHPESVWREIRKALAQSERETALG